MIYEIGSFVSYQFGDIGHVLKGGGVDYRQL
jgi:hypothetical protein